MLLINPKISIMKTKLSFIFCALFCISSFYAQQDGIEPQRPIYIGNPDRVEYVPSIASRGNLPTADLSQNKEMKDGRSHKYDIVPGKGSKGADALAQNPHRLKNKIPTKAPSLVFETAASSSQPTDPAGAVGPNHYFAVINTAFRIFDKDGNPLTTLLAPEPTIFPTGGCCDLTASYDNAADRWVITLLGGGVQVAVSDGPDPVNDGWTVYTYTAVSDYQKLSVWRDGYYMTENTGSSNKLHVFERDAMIDAASAGTTPQILSFELPGMVTSGFHSPQALNISSDDFPSTGGATIVYMQDDAWGGVSTDHIKIWNADVDWATPANSLVSTPVEMATTAFTSVFDGGSFSNLTQPSGGPMIDALQATIMNQAQFRKFSTHNSAVFNFVVDVDPDASKQAAVRWYELRQTADGQPWTLYQEGTYTAPDERHAWNASLIMDVQGNIGMGYTSMSSPKSSDANVNVGSYYTGRFAYDPIGTMTIAEEVIMAGNANIPGTRYGDYSKIDIDPDGDKKFWFVNEVMNNGRKNIAGVFQIAPNTNNDVGVVSVDTPISGGLTNNETVTVTVFNFGENPASGFNVNYQVDGGTTVSEAFVGTLASQASAQHIFSTTANLSTEGQTYSITSCTTLGIDEDTTNDCVSTNILHIFSNDIGVTSIIAPTSGEGLTNETVTVTIENFGHLDQTGFDVNYIINGGTPVVETVGVTVPAGGSISYSFTTLANLSTVGAYSISSSTLLTGDADASNDTATTSVTNVSCLTNSNNTVQNVGPDSGTLTTSIISFTDDFIIDDVNVTVNVDHTYIGDLDVKLIAPNGTEIILVENQIGLSSDNFTNTVFDDEASIPLVNGTAPFTGSFQPAESLSTLDGSMSAGDWTLEILDNYGVDGGKLNNWSLQLCGNVVLSIDDILFEDGFTVINDKNNQFIIKLPKDRSNERLNMTVLSTLGQILYWRTLDSETNANDEYKLDMSYVSAGVYFVKIGNNKASNTQRIIVN